MNLALRDSAFDTIILAHYLPTYDISLFAPAPRFTSANAVSISSSKRDVGTIRAHPGQRRAIPSHPPTPRLPPFHPPFHPVARHAVSILQRMQCRIVLRSTAGLQLPVTFLIHLPTSFQRLPLGNGWRRGGDDTRGGECTAHRGEGGLRCDVGFLGVSTCDAIGTEPSVRIKLKGLGPVAWTPVDEEWGD